VNQTVFIQTQVPFGTQSKTLPKHRHVLHYKTPLALIYNDQELYSRLHSQTMTATLTTPRKGSTRHLFHMWSVAVSPGQFAHKSSSSVEIIMIHYLHSDGNNSHRMKSCNTLTYHCTWSHTICSNNGHLSGRMSRFEACQRSIK